MFVYQKFVNLQLSIAKKHFLAQGLTNFEVYLFPRIQRENSIYCKSFTTVIII